MGEKKNVTARKVVVTQTKAGRNSRPGWRQPAAKRFDPWHGTPGGPLGVTYARVDWRYLDRR